MVVRSGLVVLEQWTMGVVDVDISCVGDMLVVMCGWDFRKRLVDKLECVWVLMKKAMMK